MIKKCQFIKLVMRFQLLDLLKTKLISLVLKIVEIMIKNIHPENWRGTT